MKKILVLGGTGAMGVYLVPKLAERGYRVDVVSLDDVVSDNPNINYIKMNALDDAPIYELLKNEYNAIVDFLIYANPRKNFKERMKMFLENTEHYLYFSTYRIYANDKIITENSPRLWNVSEDKEFLQESADEYSLYKAIGEDMLVESGYKNWSIIRPAITYSKFRYQLTTLEAHVVIYRMANNKTILLPQEAMDKQATMSWAGDVAEMLARIILNKEAYGEAYTVATAEHHTWSEIADYYTEIGGLKYKTVDAKTYVDVCFAGSKFAGWQLKYDRMFDRVIDNSKILNVTGMKQSELMPLRKGLEYELSRLPKNHIWRLSDINTRIDAFLQK